MITAAEVWLWGTQREIEYEQLERTHQLEQKTKPSP